MISRIKKFLDTEVVLLSERQKKILIDFIIKVLKSNIFLFFVFGTIVSIVGWNHINFDNFYGVRRLYFIFLTIELTLYNFIPFLVAIIMNLIIKFFKNEKIKKIFKILMIITNIISVLYLSLIVFLECTLAVPTPS